MNITSELERLTTLRDRGDLSDAEFQKAKTLVLAEEEVTCTHDETPDASVERRKKTQFLIGILAALAAVLSGGSAIIDPSLFTFGMLIFWAGLSISGWTSYSKLKNEAGRTGQSEPQK